MYTLQISRVDRITQMSYNIYQNEQSSLGGILYCTMECAWLDLPFPCDDEPEVMSATTLIS